MNIAFSTLLIFLFILPGLFFTLAFYNTDNKPLNYISLTHKAAVSFFITFLSHLFGLFILVQCLKYQINYTAFFTLISGAQNSLYTSAIESIDYNELIHVIVYLLLVYIIAFAIGKLIRWGIRKLKLDKRFDILRLDSPWYYLFTGYDWEEGQPDGVMISACMDFGGQAYLYQGYLERFFLDEEGNIERLVLTSAERRKIEDDKIGTEAQGTSTRFYPIDGHYFVLKYSEIKNLNVQFIKVQLKE
jgi:hypothetical protein